MPILHITLATLSLEPAYQNNGQIRLNCGSQKLIYKSATTNNAQIIYCLHKKEAVYILPYISLQ